MNNYRRHPSWKSRIILFVLGFFLSSNLIAQNAASSNEPENSIISSVRSGNIDVFDRTAEQLQIKNENTISELVSIMTDNNSPNLQRCAAAYFLGEMHATNAVDALAANISLILEEPIDHLTVLEAPPAVEALVKISTPSILPVIQNLENNDNSTVRELSLRVLYRIEGDKDIVQLRLQKALAKQGDPQKKARLQSALDALANASFKN